MRSIVVFLYYMTSKSLGVLGFLQLHCQYLVKVGMSACVVKKEKNG